VDTLNYEMVTPVNDSLPCVERGVPYQAVLQFFCPPQIAGIDIYSIKVTNFLNLPSGIVYSCTPDSCILHPWQHACILFYGTTTDTTGIYSIKYNGMAYTSQGNASFSYLQNLGILPEYSLTVIEAGDPCREAINTGVNSISANGFFTVYPNPTKGTITVNLKQNSLPATLTITDFMGRIIDEERLTGSNSSILLNLSDESKGIYIVQLRNANGVQAQKVSIE
jgi:hypothetical protein